MIKILSTLVFCFVLSSTTWSSQGLLRLGTEKGLLQGLQKVSRGIHLPVRLFSTDSLDDKPSAPERKTMHQVFSRPTHDRIAKYVLSEDEAVRIDVLKAFTGIDSLTSARQLDEHYNPFDPLYNLRKLINSASSQEVFETVRDSSDVEVILGGKKNKKASELLKGLSGLYSDLAHAFPSQRNRSTVDFLCETDFGFITIEFQVAKQDYWDKRALAYISSIYGNQLRTRDDYVQIQNVIGVNLLGDGSTPYWKDGGFVRDYTFVDQKNSKNKIPSLRLVQYSLGDANLNHPDLKENEKLRQWIEFFKSAHEKKATPPSVDEPVKKAYDMIRVDKLKSGHPELLRSADEFFASLTEHDKAVAEKTKIEIAEKMIGNDKLSDQDISDVSGLSLADVNKLRK
ncbi:MAG: PD-(D/E)XK nuclease family transposase [Cyanobacteriota bacterium]|jgi:predicted transposase/invertase (TIGR01784 family)